MAVKHCGSNRRTMSYWLVPKKEDDREKNYARIKLETANCPNCDQFIMEWTGYLVKGRGPTHRLKHKEHDEWMMRTKTDLDEEIDTSAWKSIANGVHRVNSSMQQHPFIAIEVNVR